MGREARQIGGTVFLSVPNGHSVANLLRGGVLRALVEEGRRHVVLLSPFCGDPAFRDEFDHPRLTHEPLAPHRPGVLERVIESVLSEKFLLESRLTAVRLQRDRARLTEPWPGRRVLAGTKGGVSRLPLSRRSWYRALRAVTPTRGYDRLLDRYRPALVVTATAGFFLAEAPLICAAWRAGVPQMAVDLGWDNLSSKYHTIMPVDGLVLWNEPMRQEAIAYHGFDPGQVHVSGPVQFDHYFRGDALPSREEFLRAVGADTSRRLVTLATTPKTMYPSTLRLVDALASAIRDGRLGPPAQLLVRVHPRDDLDVYDQFGATSWVRVEKPLGRLAAAEGLPPYDAVSPSSRDRVHLAATLAYSDVLVNFASTTTIEACIFDTPVVNVGVDEEPDLPLPLSIRRYYAYEHYQPVVESGAVPVATTLDELVAHVRRGLEHPEERRAARRALVGRLCPFQDGGAARRVARAIEAAADGARLEGAA